MSALELRKTYKRDATLDEAHVGDIRGAFGTIRYGDQRPRNGWQARIRTLLAIIGPGLIVMVGDNDAGAFGTYTQAGQNCGTTLLWTLMLLVPVLYVNQEMVLRLGAVTGIGHARLILERFGRFWGAFSIIDLFLLNALTIVTEFIGISLALGYLGLPRALGVIAAAAVIIAAAATGDFRRFERFSLLLVFGSRVANGGLGILIGDGQLQHYSPEAIIETYYKLSVVEGMSLTADYQLIDNPAYNSDRGPVSVFGARIHLEF